MTQKYIFFQNFFYPFSYFISHKISLPPLALPQEQTETKTHPCVCRMCINSNTMVCAMHGLCHAGFILHHLAEPPSSRWALWLVCQGLWLPLATSKWKNKHAWNKKLKNTYNSIHKHYCRRSRVILLTVGIRVKLLFPVLRIFDCKLMNLSVCTLLRKSVKTW